MARFTVQLYLGCLSDLLDEGGRWLIVLEPLRREDYLVNVLSLIHLDESLVIDGQLVDRSREFQYDAVNLGSTWQLLYHATQDASLLEPRLDQVGRNQCLIQLAGVVVNYGVEA